MKLLKNSLGAILILAAIVLVFAWEILALPFRSDVKDYGCGPY